MLCGCLATKDADSAIELARNSDSVDMLEVRIDYFDDPYDAIRLIPKLDLPVIATFRRSCDGGRDVDEELRLSLLGKAISQASYVDLEHDLADDDFARLLGIAAENNCRVICSFHDFNGTPDDLNSISKKVMERGDIGKIVTSANSIEDCHRVLELILRNNNMIAFCMGQKFRFTRAVSLIYGSPFAYCRMGSAVGSGQYTAGEMRNILEELL